jgi:hypothetical protein
VLGPFTLVRPWVVVGAAAFGLAAAQSAMGAALTVLCASGPLVLARALDVLHRKEEGAVDGVGEAR